MKILLIVLVVLWQNASSEINGKLQLAVYYESKCPDSVKFITRQLVPAVSRLHEYLDLTLVPFGKAHSIPTTQHNQQRIKFTCQHGPAECLGNRVQDCALHIMQDKSDLERLAYVKCEMERFSGASGNYWCVQNAGVDLNRIDSCVNSNEGTELQLVSEHATKQVSPRFIPTITINGVFNQHNQDNALQDLTGTLCSLMTNAPPCANYYNTQALTSLIGYSDYYRQQKY